MLYRLFFIFCILIQFDCTYLQSSQKPLFKAHPKQPYHLSVGAVLFDHNGRIGCHHFKEIFGFKDIYILMHESVEDGETPLETLNRGLMEEFGATAQPKAFLGCLSGYLSNPKLSFDKTTLYLVCQLIDWAPSMCDKNDPESESIIEWLEPNQLMQHMKRQGEIFKRVDADESEIIRRAMPYIEGSLCKSQCN